MLLTNLSKERRSKIIHLEPILGSKLITLNYVHRKLNNLFGTFYALMILIRQINSRTFWVRNIESELI